MWTRDLKTFGCFRYLVFMNATFGNLYGSNKKEVRVLLDMDFVLRPISIGMVLKYFRFCIFKQKLRGMAINIEIEGLLLNKLTRGS